MAREGGIEDLAPHEIASQAADRAVDEEREREAEVDVQTVYLCGRCNAEATPGQSFCPVCGWGRNE